DDGSFGDEDAWNEGPATPATRRLSREERFEPIDPNATTLVSPRGPRPRSEPPPSVIGIEEAAPLSDDGDRDRDQPVGFVAEDDEPPLSADDEPRGREETLVPVVDDIALAEQEEARRLLEAIETRQTRLRRGVAMVLGAIALVAIGLVVRAKLDPTPEPSLATAPPSGLSGRRAAPVAATDTKATDTASKPLTDEVKKDAPEAAAATEEKASEDEQAEVVPEGDYKALSTETLELLNKRKFEDAVVTARRLVELDPDNAFGYRCLGAALQDQGKVAEAREVYSQCVTRATKGEVAECGALGGSRKKR
ncbi:MAG: hypothetical protein KC731_34380, partial [Myxococcales bacterium]|nr:hypothetical protein [Myxococcales bacterium]